MMDSRTALPRHVPLVVATRGETVESVHCGSVAATDAEGRLLFCLGDAVFPVFTRSTLKPFQALPLIEDGGAARLGFTTEQVALMCASHSGEPRHTAGVADMLAKAGCSVAQLQCGCHVPLFYAATGAAAPAGLDLTPLQHNCSGKHAGFLAWCTTHHEPTGSYLDPDHPLQRKIRRTVADFAHCTEKTLPMGVDGCGAPNYAMPLAHLAHAYARLATHAAEDEHGVSLRTLFQAMIGHPEMVSGAGRGDLALMQAARGDWVAKAGAEGVQAIGIASRGIGIAIKIADGSSRGLQVATVAVLERLGILPAAEDHALRTWRTGEIRNHAGALTGRLLPTSELAGG